jgi:rfaE bifunctional protein nucleotidyltransferase chain/domain
MGYKLTRIQSMIHPSMADPGFMRRLHTWRFLDRKLVFTNGCFDLLHLGHLDYLSRAAELGQVLIIGLNTDASVRRLKGAGRPVCDERTRATLLASLSFVDAVVLFDEDTPLELIRTIRPDVLVKGGDYRKEEIVGHDLVLEKNGKVVVMDFLEGYSSSAIIEKIRSRT